MKNVSFPVFFTVMPPNEYSVLIDNYNYYIIYFQKSQVILNNYCNILQKLGRRIYKLAVKRCLKTFPMSAGAVLS